MATKPLRTSQDSTTVPARKVGLALGSGSARGLAHIGVLRAIEEAGIGVDFIAGTSMGALIGAVYAAGKLDELEATFQSFDWKKTLSFFDVVLPKSGLLDGAKVSALVREHVQSELIEALPRPFASVATDIVSGEEVAIDRGDVIDAVRASISVPGVFTPMRSNGRILVDGGLTNPVPVSVARKMGADIVIAVDLNHEIVAGKNLKPLLAKEQQPARPTAFGRWVEGYRQAMLDVKARMLAREMPGAAQFARWASTEEPLPSIFEVLLASINIMETRITESRLRLDRPDILIRPPLGHVRFLQFDRAEEIIEIGYRSASEQLAERLSGR
jgi:NTE family protein